jgi:hypothetical protein
MRIKGLALIGTAVAFTGMLAICFADPVFAAKKQMTTYEARQNGVTVKTPFENPDRVPNRSAQFYRTSHQKKHKSQPGPN